MTVKGRRTANSQGRRKGRITRSMTSEVEESTAPPLSSELGEYRPRPPAPAAPSGSGRSRRLSVRGATCRSPVVGE